MIIAFVGGQRTKREQAMRNTFPSDLFTFSVGFGMRRAHPKQITPFFEEEKQ
jgi:hypothetical protein